MSESTSRGNKQYPKDSKYSGSTKQCNRCQQPIGADETVARERGEPVHVECQSQLRADGGVPECPDCRTDVLVQRSKADNRQWMCNGCGQSWNVDEDGSARRFVADGGGFDLIASTETLQTFVDQLTPIVEECRLHVDPDGLNASAVDPASVAMVDVGLDASAFESYSAAGTEIGINVERLASALSFGDSGDLVHFELDTASRKLIVEIGDFEAEIALIDPEAVRSEPDLPDLDLSCEFVIKGDVLGRGVNAADFVDDYIRLRTTGDAVMIESEGDTDAATVTTARDDLVDVQRFGDADSLFSLDYMSDLQKPIDDDQNVRVEVGEQFPHKRHFQFAEGHGEVTQMLAPRIQSE